MHPLSSIRVSFAAAIAAAVLLLFAGSAQAGIGSPVSVSLSWGNWRDQVGVSCPTHGTDYFNTYSMWPRLRVATMSDEASILSRSPLNTTMRVTICKGNLADGQDGTWSACPAVSTKTSFWDDTGGAHRFTPFHKIGLDWCRLPSLFDGSPQEYSLRIELHETSDGSGTATYLPSATDWYHLHAAPTDQDTEHGGGRPNDVTVGFVADQRSGRWDQPASQWDETLDVMDNYDVFSWMQGGDYVYPEGPGNDPNPGNVDSDAKASLAYYIALTDPSTSGHPASFDFFRPSNELVPAALLPGNHEELFTSSTVDQWMSPAWNLWTFNYRNGDTNFYDDDYISDLTSPYAAPGMTCSYFSNRLGDQRWIMLNSAGKDEGDGHLGMRVDLTAEHDQDGTALSSSSTSITFTSSSGLHVGDYLVELNRTGSLEIIKLGSQTGATFDITNGRAQCGTTATSHSASTKWRVCACPSNSRQANWFSIELLKWYRNSDTKWLIVAVHNPLCYAKAGDYWGSNSAGAGKTERANVIRLLDEYGVDLVLEGDHHTYARHNLAATGGTMPFVLNGCAAMQDPRTANVPDDFTFTQQALDTSHYCCTIVRSSRDAGGAVSLAFKTIGHSSGSSAEVAVDPTSGWLTAAGVSPAHNN